MAFGTRIDVMGNAAGTNTINSLFILEEPTANLWPALASYVGTNWVAHMRWCQGNIFTWTSCTISSMRPGGPASQSFPINQIGAISFLMPMQVAFVIKVGTGASGRSFNGRWFISGIGTGMSLNGKPAPSDLTTWGTHLNAVLNAFKLQSGNPYSLALYSRKQDTLHPVLSLSCSPIFGTLRSRRFSVGI